MLGALTVPLSILALVVCIASPPDAALLVAAVGSRPGPAPTDSGAPPSPLPPDGAEPLGGSSPDSDPAGPAPVVHSPMEGADSSHPEAGGSPPPVAVLPFGPPPAPEAPPRLDPKATRLVRIDVLLGPVWRIRAADMLLSTSVEVGRMHGLSGSFNTGMIVGTDRDFARTLDFPVGLGVVARGRLRDKPLYGSVGLSAGILVHRAATDLGVIRRVDPDFRLPIRLAWTAAGVGASLAVVPGYSVRERVYERRGFEVLKRHSVRIGLVLGLHYDLVPGRAKPRRSARR